MPASPRKNSNSSDSSSSRRSTSPRAVISPDAMQHAAKLSEVNASYVILMVTSGILAAVAMLTNSIPVLIGSMVIAPALPPLALLSFAIINRRPKLVRKGFVSACCGLALAVLAALVTTWLLNATHVIPKETNLLDLIGNSSD